MNTRTHQILFTYIFFFLCCTAVQAQPSLAEMPPTIFQHLIDKNISHITIASDLTRLISEKKKLLSLDATILLTNSEGFEEEMAIKLEVRGRNRRRVCSIPPLRLDFSKKDLSEIGLSKTGDKLKLVTHCKEEYGDEYLLKEYWTYKLYNQVTPISFRAHLLHIHYLDTSAPDREVEDHMAFIIESEDELAARFNCKNEDLFGLKPETVDKKSYQYNVLFQYMIGNDDWGMTNPRNLSFLVPVDGAPTMVVPYDFDFSGLVDAPYALPNPNYSAKNVLDRVALGYFPSKEELYDVIDDFMQVQDSILTSYQSCQWLDNNTKKTMSKYLKGFFKELKNEKKMESIFLTTP